jgi:Tfp pilus assembly protein PilX
MKDQRGMALPVSLMSMMMVTALSTAFVMTAVQEKTMSSVEVQGAKSFYAAESGANAGLVTLGSLINQYMLAKVNATNPSVLATDATAYANTANGLGLLVAYVKNGNTALLTRNGSEAVYNGTTVALDNGSAVYTIHITQKANPSSSTVNVWDFPYNFRIQSTGVNGSQVNKMSLSGDFTVRVQKDNFARYALFTNSQTMPDGSQVWFTGSAHFSGPLFTNGQYNFAYNPSGTFSDTVQQSIQQARFYNNNSPILLDASSNGSRDVPVFSSAFTRGVAGISMPTSVDETSMANEAAGGNTYASNSVNIPSSGGALTGGIYVYGDTAVNLSVDGSSRQVITITPASGSAKTITLSRATNQTLVTSGASTTTYSGLPDGISNVGTVLYVRGNITAFSGTVQASNQMTVAARNDMVINNNVRYSSYTAASGTPGAVGYVPPSAEGYNNLLGLVSWQGNVRIATTAPANLDVHATVMAKQGIFTVDNYNSISARGTVTLLGGVITNNYGAFGTFNSSTGVMVSGYTRNFTYDTRMLTSMTPPYFPTMNTFIAFTNDIADNLSWQQGGF